MMASSELVPLRGGLVVAAPALRLLWQLENKGFSVRVVDDRLQVLPATRLTSALVSTIRQHRDALIELVRYQPDHSHLFTDSLEARSA